MSPKVVGPLWDLDALGGKNEKLLDKFNMPSIYQSINNQALNYIHRLQSTKTPTALYNMYKIPNRPQRTNQLFKPIYEPKTKQLKASIFFKYTQIYNQLPLTLKHYQS